MRTLYEMGADYVELLDMITEGVDPQVIQDTLEGLEGEIEEKCDNCAKLCRELKHRAAGLREEAERMIASARACENSEARIMEHMQHIMELTGKTKFKTKLFSYGIQNNPATVVLDSLKDIPKEYLIEQEPKVDKKAIKQAIQDGVDFTGIAHLETKTSLRIR